MLNQAATAAIRILLFRAGPQDFPYSASLTRAVVAFAVLAGFLQYRLTLPDGQALVQAAAGVAVLAVVTQLLLKWRRLSNRLQQTLNSLYATSAIMTAVLLAPLASIAPHMVRIAENPELARTDPLPALPAFAVMLLSLWHFCVTAHIYRHALDAPMGVGALAALMSTVLTVLFAGTVASLAGGT